MDTALFLEQFGHLTGSPDGIQKLRSLILDLAVRGKLVEQSPNDEPARELLKRIEAEKKRLVKAGEIKKSKRLPPITDDEIPYPIPYSWQWVRLGDVTNYGNTDKADPEEVSNPELWVLDLQDIEKVTSKLLQKVRLADREFQSTKNVFYEGDVLYGKLRPYLDKVIVADEMGITTTEIIPFNGFGCISPYYIRWYMKSHNFIRYANNSTHGMNLPRLSTTNAQLAVLALPPLAEQQRIVARVDKLMELCDQLEAEQAERDYLRERATKSTLYHLSNSSSKADVRKYWGYAEQHFPELFDRVSTVEDLRATILQLAVQGRLVPQNPDDEPASELLKRIESEKKRLYEAGEISKPKKLSPIDNEEIPYELPVGWEWERLGNIFKESVYGTSEKASASLSGGVPVYGMGHIQNGSVIDRNFKYLPQTSDAIPKLYLQTYDLLFNRTNSYELVGKTGIFLGESDTRTFASYLIRVALLVEFTSPHYLNYYMNSPVFRTTQIEPEITQQTNQANFNGTKLSNTLVPFPPLDEQKRIVLKVNELMELCDQLAEEVEYSRALSGRLFDSIVYHLFEPSM